MSPYTNRRDRDRDYLAARYAAHQERRRLLRTAIIGGVAMVMGTIWIVAWAVKVAFSALGDWIADLVTRIT